MFPKEQRYGREHSFVNINCAFPKQNQHVNFNFVVKKQQQQQQQQQQQKMASIQQKYVPTLKFKLENFEELDIPDLMINIWCHSEINKSCPILKQYKDWCITALKKKWIKEYIDFDFVVEKLSQRDKNFIRISSADRMVLMTVIGKKFC